MINISKKYIIFFLFILFLCFIFLCSCGDKYNNSNKSIIDFCNREIIIDKPIERIVVLSPSDCEILCEIGAEDYIVARSTYCDYPQSINHVKDVGFGNTVNIESIVASKPDIVIMSKSGYSIDVVNSLENLNLNVFVSDIKTLEDIYKDINLLGLICNKTNNADISVNNIKSKINEIKSFVDSHLNDSKSVYFEISPLCYGLWTAGKDTFMNDCAEILNLNNIFSDINLYKEISQEQVIQRNPNVIIATSSNYTNTLNYKYEISNRLGWQNIDAIKNNKIIVIDGLQFERPGIRLINDLENLAYEIYK